MPLPIDLIAGARPNFMKIAPLWAELDGQDWAAPRLVHTGQHYDRAMSRVFFRDLNLPEPHVNLSVGSGTHAQQTGKVMAEYEKLISNTPPTATIVVGDVNSTMAATLAATKLHVPVVHLEAGLRSFDRTMPEEINRLITDSLADLLWTPSEDADQNLAREGVAPERITMVGNIMMDSLEMQRSRIEANHAWDKFSVKPGKYVLVTMHRPENVDHPEQLNAALAALSGMAANIPVILPLHPRTRASIKRFGLESTLRGITVIEPQGYVAFMSLLFGCAMAVTDSGGIQEETTYLGIPCLTLRRNTERPVTITHGTNQLCRADTLEPAALKQLDSRHTEYSRPDLWDGRTAARCAASLRDFLK